MANRYFHNVSVAAPQVSFSSLLQPFKSKIVCKQIIDKFNAHKADATESLKIALTVITIEESVACHGRWSTGDGPVEQTSHNAGTWASEDPSAEDDTDELPVDSSDVSVAKSDSSGGTGDAVSGGDRNSETREGHHSEHSSQLDTEAAGGRL